MEPNRGSWRERRLYRSRHDAYMGGVAAGVAAYFGVDPALIRMGFLVLGAATGGVTLLIYPIMWVMVPLEPE